MNRTPTGTTQSKRALHRQARFAFLSLWSLPNIYRDQGKTKGREGKEIADLVVVFGNDVLIFSDKFCEFPTTQNAEINWSRWYRAAVVESMIQLHGAHKWITRFSNRLFSDRACTKSISIPLDPAASNFKIHLIAVASGADAPCVRHFGGGSGSLIIEPVSDDEHSEYPPPFHLRDEFPNKPFVHVFDSFTVALLMEERDTVADFVEYLNARERLIRSGQLASATGEEDLLGRYMKTYEPGIGRRFGMKEEGHLFILEGQYDDFRSRPEYRRAKRANEVSYVVDEVIERFTHHSDRGELNGDLQSPDQLERVLRALASETRASRRMIARAWVDQSDRLPRGKVGRRVNLSLDRNERAYVSVMMHKDDHPPEEYRKRRRAVLQAYSITVAHEYPSLKEIIGLATEGGSEAGKSYDMIYMDLSERDEKYLAEEAEYFRRTLRSFDPKIMRMEQTHDNEFPTQKGDYPDPPKPAKGVPRSERRRERKLERKRRKRG
ncbi:MAG: hypothetical protein JWM57_1960 [Phycisphaerales bacterium]|nr:hypothetical protein [Phycisphaerales bacterium]